MGFLGDAVGNAVNAANNNGNDVTRTDLQTFLGKFSSSAGRYVETKASRVVNSLVNSALQAGKNALDNATGGIFSSLTQGGKS